MVDNLSTEARIQSLLEESRNCSYPEDSTGIKKRYKDTSLLLFKQSQEYDSPRNYLSFGTRRASSISQYGNTPIVIRRSRSSNGGLAMVAEQVSSIRGRSSHSDYALVESNEKEEDTESDDEFDASERRNKRYENSTITDKDEDPSVTFDTGSISPSSQIQDLCFDEPHSQEDDNKKSFSHYDLPLQRHQEDSKEDVNEDGNNNKESEVIAENSHNGDILLAEKGCVRALDYSLDSVPSNNRKSDHGSIDCESNHAQNRLSSDRKGSTKEAEASWDVISFPVKSNEEDLVKETEKININSRKSESSDINHEAVLRAYVQKTTIRKNPITHNEKTEEISKHQEEKLKPGSSNDSKFVELKIIEPTDIPQNEHTRKDRGISGEKSLMATDILKFDDNDDVVFIDANSPPLVRAKFKCDSSNELHQDVHQPEDGPRYSKETTPTPPNCQSKNPENYSNLSPKPGDGCITKNSIDESSREEKPEKQSALQRLPLRSPTPPKKSPRRSPRVPAVREETKECHSSIALTSDEEVQELPSGTRSASPVSKDKDSKFFSFSLRREKSKSSSYLHSKKKERKKLPVFSVKHEDPGVINPCIDNNSTAKHRDETSGKRVGIRTGMIIDGTIKRNFIIIHPSDDSDTIGLAPLSPSQEKTGVSTPKALSSVKSRITEVNLEKFEEVKRISYQSDVKEELSATPVNTKVTAAVGKNYLPFDRISRSLRIKNNKAPEHKKLGSSKSLSSEPTMSGLIDFSKSPYTLSEVESDLLDVSAQKLHSNSPTTVSKLCVVM